MISDRRAERELMLPATLSSARNALYSEIANLVARFRVALCLQGELPADEPMAVRARLTPLDARGQPREAREVRLRELNERGLAFEHPAPLADRRAVVSIESPLLGTLAAEVDLSWCRYNEGGQYTSGGRFVQLTHPPG